MSEAAATLADVRQDAALMLHDEHRDVDDVVEFLKRWLLVNDERARQMLRFLSSPLWRAYTSTYVEGYRLLQGLAGGPAGRSVADGAVRPIARRAADPVVAADRLRRVRFRRDTPRRRRKPHTRRKLALLG